MMENEKTYKLNNGLTVITYDYTEKGTKVREFQNIEVRDNKEILIHLEKCIKVDGQEFNGEWMG